MNSIQENKEIENILVVDDAPANLRLLVGILSQSGYKVRPAPNGARAISTAQTTIPDLILLDINMPNMNGYEVCERLKTDELTKNIPIIFISALNDAMDKVKAFSVGGVDYITKPFQTEEVLIRVKTHLTIQRLQKNLQKINAQLEERVKERTAELVEENTHRKKAEQALQEINTQLEERVKERTAKLVEEIAERKKAEQEVRKSEEKYRALFEDSNDIIYISTPDGQIIDINPAGLQLLGYTKEETLKKNMRDIHHNPNDHIRFLREIEQHGMVTDFETQYIKNNGEIIDCLKTVIAKQAKDGTILSHQGIIRNITAYKQAEIERVQLSLIQQELTIAHEIQQSLLPPPKPNWTNIDVICYSVPARKVGGDFYTYHAFENTDCEHQDKKQSSYSLAIGDVSGKGIPAALLMAVGLALYQSSIERRLSPSNLLIHLDNAIKLYTNTTNQNCAFLYVEINYTPDKDTEAVLNVANAGCIVPLIRRNNGNGLVDWVEAFGVPLGTELSAEIGYQAVTVNLEKNDLVILTSDGIVEANNSRNEIFGFDRLEKAVATGPTNNAEAMLNHIKTEVATFAVGVEQHDDMTIVVIQI